MLGWVSREAVVLAAAVPALDGLSGISWGHLQAYVSYHLEIQPMRIILGSGVNRTVSLSKSCS
jgi:hypothetical protein